jgi:predicted DNA-binding mobile mystery protein A
MNTRARMKRLRLQQLDRQLNALGALPWNPPRGGWIREIREALGMNARQLAERIGVSQPSVVHMERSEAAGTIEISTLNRAAEALGCRVVYALVPTYGSLESALRQQAESSAERLLSRVEHTMALEAQGNTPEARSALREELAAELLRTLNRSLWDEATR